MFSREALKAQLPTLLAQPKPPLEVWQFAPDDFSSSSSEEYLTVCRGVKSNFESAMHFWVEAQFQAIWIEDVEDPWPILETALEIALYEPMPEDEFLQLLSYTGELKSPPAVTPLCQLLEAQWMAKECDEASAVAEFEGDFWFFFWETTA